MTTRFTCPNARKKHPLILRHNELMAERAATRGSFDKHDEMAEVEASLAQIDAGQATVLCYNRLCKNRVNLSKNRHSIVSQHAIIDHNPADQDNPVTWHYRPHIGDAVYCEDCAKYLHKRQAEQIVEEG